jgi:hypothetical protein
LPIAPSWIEGVALVAQLRHDLMFLRRLHQGANLRDRVGQGLFAIHMFVPLDCRHRRHSVRVVGRPDDHGVDLVAHLVEHLAEILVHLGIGELGDRGALAMLRPQVRIAQGRHPHAAVAGHLVDVGAALAAGADTGDVQFLTGRGRPLAQHVPRHDRERRGRPRRRFQ